MTSYFKMEDLKYDRILTFFVQVATLCIFLPYISPFPISSDTQPLAIVICTLTIVFIFSSQTVKMKPIKIPYISMFSALSCGYVVSLSLIYGSFELRGIASYISLLVFSMFGSIIAVRPHMIKAPLLLAAVLWLVVGVAQLLLSKDFGTIFQHRATSSISRGVVSLASEPSHYSMMCVLLIVFLDIYKTRIRNLSPWVLKLQITFGIQILFLSRSTFGILALLLWIFIKIYLSFKKKMISTVLISIVFAFSVYVAKKMNLHHEFRLVYLVSEIIENISEPQYIFIKDASANARAADIIISTYSFFESIPLPIGHGLGTWKDYLGSADENFDYLWHIVPGSNRIMSGYGGLLYEVGLLGFILIISIFFSLYRLGSPEVKVAAVFLTIFMFTAVPIATPIFGFIVGFGSCYFAKQSDTG